MAEIFLTIKYRLKNTISQDSLLKGKVLFFGLRLEIKKPSSSNTTFE